MPATKSIAQVRHEEVMGEITELKKALVGTDKEPGFFERVRKLEDWVAAQKKLYFFVGTVFLGDLIVRLLQYLNK